MNLLLLVALYHRANDAGNDTDHLDIERRYFYLHACKPKPSKFNVFATFNVKKYILFEIEKLTT